MMSASDAGGERGPRTGAASVVSQPDLVRWLRTDRHQGRLIWLCNIGVEQHWRDSRYALVDHREDEVVSRIADLPLLLGREQDVVLLREHPDPLFLDLLKSLGLGGCKVVVANSASAHTCLTELLLRDESAIEELRQYVEASSEPAWLVPFGVSKWEEELGRLIGAEVFGAPSDVGRKVNSKLESRMLAMGLGMPVATGEICESLEQVRAAWGRLASGATPRTVVIKQPHGASGKGMYLVRSATQLEATLRLLERVYEGRETGPHLVECWHEKLADLNYQLQIGPSGPTPVFSLKSQLVEGVVYVGSVDPSAVSRELEEAIRNAGQRIGARLQSKGYRGIASVDGMVLGDGTLIPIVEINGRLSLSTYTSFLRDRLGCSVLLTGYHRLSAHRSIAYSEILDLLSTAGLRYDRDLRRGVIVYSASSLPRDSGKGHECIGRAFFAVCADNRADVGHLHRRFQGTMAMLVDDSNSGVLRTGPQS